MYLPARVWSQQNQDSKFRTGVLHILAGHSGPETAADARTRFGIFAPQWKFPPDQSSSQILGTTNVPFTSSRLRQPILRLHRALFAQHSIQVESPCH